MLEYALEAVDDESVVEEGLELCFAFTVFESPLFKERLCSVVITESLGDKRLCESVAVFCVKLKKSHGDGLQADVGVVVLLDELHSLCCDFGNLFEELNLTGGVVDTALRVFGLLSFDVLEVENLGKLGEVFVELTPVLAVGVGEVILRATSRLEKRIID